MRRRGGETTANTDLHEPASDRLRGVERAGEVHGEPPRRMPLDHLQERRTFDHPGVRDRAAPVSGASTAIARGSRSARRSVRQISMAIAPVLVVTATTRRTRIRGVWLAAAMKAILEPFPGRRQVPGPTPDERGLEAARPMAISSTGRLPRPTILRGHHEPRGHRHPRAPFASVRVAGREACPSLPLTISRSPAAPAASARPSARCLATPEHE
jgi:hypothetical protein